MRVTTLIVFCIDPRYLPSVMSFITEELRLQPGEFIILPAPGGALHLCGAGGNSIARIYMHDVMRFCCGDFPHLEQCVIISHQQCIAYAKASERQGEAFLDGMGMEDVQMRHLSGILPEGYIKAIPKDKNISIRGFYMRVVDEEGEEVAFDEVEINPEA